MSEKSFFFEGRRFKNGSVHIRFSPDEIKELLDKSEREAVILACNKLEAFDFELISEDFECLGNSGWYLQFMCNNNAKTYSLSCVHMAYLLAGKTAVLRPTS